VNLTGRETGGNLDSVLLYCDTVKFYGGHRRSGRNFCLRFQGWSEYSEDALKLCRNVAWKMWLRPWEEERIWSPFQANGSGGERKWEDGPRCDRCGQDIVMENAPYCITGPFPHFIRFDHKDGGSVFLQNLLMSRKGQKVVIKIQTAIETASCSFTDPKRSVVLS
jgi:hypothetical protein